MMQNIQEIIAKYELKSGSHKSIKEGSCVMELVSYLANEPWSDRPQCACPVLTSFAIRYNDHVDDVQRQKLKALIPKLLNSRDKDKKKARYQFFANQAIKVFLPLLTEALGLVEITEELRGFADNDWIAARDYINSVRPQIRDAAYAAATAYAAAYAAADADAAAAAAAYAAADAAAAAYAYVDAAAADAPKWLVVRQKIWDAGLEALEKACDL